MYKIFFPIIILVLNLLPTEVIYSQEVVDSQALPSNSEVVYNLLKRSLAKNKWEEAKTLLEHLKFLLNTSNGYVKFKDLNRLEAEVNELLKQNLEHLYGQGLRQMNNSQLTEALMTFKKILYYESGYKDTEELLRRVMGIRENLTKTTVTSPTLDIRQTGLRIYKPEKCYNGYTLIAHGPCDNLIEVVEAFPIYLIDMEGNVVYQWMADSCPTLTRLKPNGHLFYIDGADLRELDMQSNVVWSYSTCMISHAFDFAENNNFIIDRDDYFDECSRTCRDKNNKPTDRVRIEIISPDKNVLWSWKGEEHQEQILRLLGVRIPEEGSNNNTCEILKENPLSAKDSRFRKGNILFSYNASSVIGIIEYTSGEVVWACGAGILDGQHAPTMLDNGNILIFDNGRNRGWARAIELNPLTEEIIWEYHAQPKEDFYTKISGNAIRLPNGNTLICEGWTNRIFEITPEGEVVWDFISEFNKLSGKGNIYQAHRYSEEYVRPLLEARKKMLGKSKNGSGKDKSKPIGR